jgi:hypothetical protein
MMFKALVVAMTLLAGTMTPAWSLGVPPQPQTTPPVVGPWIVGGVIVSALSLMVCSQVVGKATHKEMTSEQALGAAFLPFSCLWWRTPPAHAPH